MTLHMRGSYALILANLSGPMWPAKITPEFVRGEIAAGRAIIPANINHPELEPMIIGRNFKVKIKREHRQLRRNLIAGRGGRQDDLGCSLGRGIRYGSVHRESTSMKPASGFCAMRRFPSGPYRYIRRWRRWGGKAEALTWELFRDTLIEQAEQGVDYFTIHAGVRLQWIPLTVKRPHGHCLSWRLHHGEVVPDTSQRKLSVHAL